MEYDRDTVTHSLRGSIYSVAVLFLYPHVNVYRYAPSWELTIHGGGIRSRTL
jgi:hypothetical protein